MIHTVKGFGIVNKAEIDVFLDCLAFSMIRTFTVPCRTVSLSLSAIAQSPDFRQLTIAKNILFLPILSGKCLSSVLA